MDVLAFPLPVQVIGELGAPLARLEDEIVFNELLRRFPNVDGNSDATWQPSLTLRGLERFDCSVS